MSSYQRLKQEGESGNIKDWELPTSIGKCERLVCKKKGGTGVVGAEKLACCQLKIEQEVGSLSKMGAQRLNASWGEGGTKVQTVLICLSWEP